MKKVSYSFAAKNTFFRYHVYKKTSWRKNWDREEIKV